MTTPRVAVPVDDLAQEIRRVDGNHDLGAGALAEALMPFLSQCLSAAPAPEGGAVWNPYQITPNDIAAILDQNADCSDEGGGLLNASQLSEKIWRAGLSALATRDEAPAAAAASDALNLLSHMMHEMQRSGTWDAETMARVVESVDHWIRDFRQATREEAPAEAGDLDRAIKRMRGQLVGSATFTRLMFGREDVRLVLDTLSALRAQPPAREMVSTTDDGGDGLVARLWQYGNDYIKGDAASESRARDMQDAAGLLNFYRAQPPVREDAQPVARISPDDVVKMTAFANNHGTVEDWHVWCRIRSALTTHPAPDACGNP